MIIRSHAFPIARRGQPRLQTKTFQSQSEVQPNGLILKVRDLVQSKIEDPALQSLAMRIPLIRAIQIFFQRKCQRIKDFHSGSVGELQKTERAAQTYEGVLAASESVLYRAFFSHSEVKADELATANAQTAKAINCFNQGNIADLLDRTDFTGESYLVVGDPELISRWQRLSRDPQNRLHDMVRKSLIVYGVSVELTRQGKPNGEMNGFYVLTLAHLNRTILDAVEPRLLDDALVKLKKDVEAYLATIV